MFERLSRADVPTIWADLGCGDGTFTLALAERLAPGSIIHALDRDPGAVAKLPRTAGAVRIDTHVGDFTRPWPFAAPVDGILMANSLHYVRPQAAFLRRCVAALPSSGRLLFVEYDTDTPNPWVPYPVSMATLTRLLEDVGLPRVSKIGARPSRYRRAQLYAALAER